MCFVGFSLENQPRSVDRNKQRKLTNYSALSPSGNNIFPSSGVIKKVTALA